MDKIEIRLGKGLGDMRDQMDNMLDEMCQLSRAFIPRRGTCWVPPVDIFETPDEFIVLAEMAGVDKENIRVTVDQGVLKVAGKRLNPIQDPHRRVHQMEVDFGPFERMIRIRSPIATDAIQAVYRDGFLTIRMPKGNRVHREIKVEEVIT
jgi:HSP20 family protein